MPAGDNDDDSDDNDKDNNIDDEKICSNHPTHIHKGILDLVSWLWIDLTQMFLRCLSYLAIIIF